MKAQTVRHHLLLRFLPFERDHAHSPEGVGQVGQQIARQCREEGAVDKLYAHLLNLFE